MTRVLMIAVTAALLTGCSRQLPLESAAATAVSPTGGRAIAAAQIAADWRAQRYTFDDAMHLAFDYLDSARDGTPLVGTKAVVKSADATAFAGAVLDAMKTCEGQMPKHDDMILFWYRVGVLAFRAAEEAHANGRLSEAATLVFAGPSSWQNEGYWYTHPNHDGLAAAILAQTGRRNEAIARLQSRIELNGAAAEVYEMLMKGQ